MTLLKDKSPADVHLMAGRAREALRIRLRTLAREHTDRIKALTELMQQIASREYKEGETLAGVDSVSVSPELENLIDNQTYGL